MVVYEKRCYYHNPEVLLYAQHIHTFPSNTHLQLGEDYKRLHVIENRTKISVLAHGTPFRANFELSVDI